MKPLSLLRAFIVAKDTNEERHEIREYTRAHGAELAEAFGVALDKFTTAIDEVGDDEILAKRLTLTIRERQGKLRTGRAEERAAVAQTAADELSRSVAWRDGAAFVEFPRLVGLLTGPGRDLVVFAREGTFEVAVRKDALRSLAAIRPDATLWVDATGAHLRWARGGLNLTPQVDDDAGRVTLNLPAVEDTLPAPVEISAPPAPAVAPAAAPVTRKAPPAKKGPMSVDAIIEQFQNACLAKLAEVEAVAAREVARLEAEAASLRGDCARAASEQGRLVMLHAEADGERERLRAELAEARSLLAAAQAPANTESAAPDVSEEVEGLREELARVSAELAEMTEERDSFKAEAEKLEKEAEENQIPEPMILAAAAHDYLRTRGVLPANLDAPLRVVDHEYMTGLAHAVGSELP